MIEPFVVLGCVIACAGVSASSLPSTDLVNPDGAAASSQRRVLRRRALQLTIAASLTLVWLAAVGMGVAVALEPLTVIAAIGAAAAVLHPWPWIRRIVIPLGMPRLAFVLSYLSSAKWDRDPAGGRMLTAALAKLHQRRHDPRTTSELRRRLGEHSIGGASIVAAALLAADEGEDQTARNLIEALDFCDPEVVPPLARQIALEWSIADDATHGRWASIVRRTEHVRRPSRTVHFIALAARRLEGESISDFALVRAWASAPRRRITLSLLRRALLVRRAALVEGADDAPRAIAANDAGDPVRTLVALHLETGRAAGNGSLHPAALGRLSDVWARAIADANVVQWVRQRALQTPRATVIGIINDLLRQAAADVSAMVPAVAAPLDGAASGVLRHGLATYVDRQVEHLAETAEEVEALCRTRTRVPALVLFEACLRLRAIYCELRAVTGLAPARHLFGMVEHALSGAATLLWNSDRQRALAHAIALWLLLESELVQHATAAEHRRRLFVIGA